MRNQTQSSKIWATREASQRSAMSQNLKLFTGSNMREFFKYQDGKLQEYELTRCNGKNIILSEVELRGIEEFCAEEN